MTINYKQITADFQQRYAETWIHARFKETDIPRLFYLAEVRATDEAPILTLMNKPDGTVKLSYNTECEVSFPFPKVGYFLSENKKAALLFQRLTSRQWKRGICKGNSVITTPYQEWIKLYIHYSEALLTNAFSPQYFPLNEAVEAIRKREVLSLPLSQHLAIGASPSTAHPDPVVWFLGKPVASYANGVIRVRETQFMQEIVDFVKRTGSYVQII